MTLNRTLAAICGALTAAAFLLLSGTPASAAGVPVTAHIGGKDRYATAIAVTRSAFPEHAEVVYLASGDDFPDALSAGAVTVHRTGALLLTQPKVLRADVRAEIRRLAPERIIVVGGRSAVSDAVLTALRPLAATVTRIGGTDRYDTSRQLVASAFTGPIDNLYIATGRTFPDALSAVPTAARGDDPVLLVDGTGRALNNATRALITKLRPNQITVIGGASAVSPAIFDSASTLAWTWRKGGANRYETSAIVGANWHSAPHAYAATGQNFPDALTGGVLAGMKGEPLFLVQPGCPAAAVDAVQPWMQTTSLTVFGGPSITINESARSASCVRVAARGSDWDGMYLP